MNAATIRGLRLRRLAHAIAAVDARAAQQVTEREHAIRDHGIAHPRSIAASRRLSETRQAHSALHRLRIRYGGRAS